jgi:hypothetical protein
MSNLPLSVIKVKQFKLHERHCVQKQVETWCDQSWNSISVNFSTILDYSGQKNIHNFFEITIETDLKTDWFGLLWVSLLQKNCQGCFVMTGHHWQTGCQSQRDGEENGEAELVSTNTYSFLGFKIYTFQIPQECNDGWIFKLKSHLVLLAYQIYKLNKWCHPFIPGPFEEQVYIPTILYCQKSYLVLQSISNVAQFTIFREWIVVW